SSPPAQAARTTGSSSIAAHVTSLVASPTGSFDNSLGDFLGKVRSPLSFGAETKRSLSKLEITENGTGPPPLGKQWRTGRAMSRRAQRGNVDRTAPFGKP